MSRNAIDLPVLDRDVRRAAMRVEHLRGLLARGTDDARTRARALDIWDGVRHTATQATYRALVELEPSILDVPLRDGLLRWVHELLQVRVGQDLALDDADAVHAFDPRLPAGRIAEAKKAAAERASRPEEGVAASEDRACHTYADAFATAIVAGDDARASNALELAGELAGPVAAVRKERRIRRFEAARRLGLAHPSALATTVDVRAAALGFLDASEPLAVELLKAARKKHEGPWRATSAIQLALAREANDGWPAYLSPRWLDDVFKALAPRGVDPGPLPPPLGGASFVRAATSWGFAWRTAGAARAMPFGLARDPYPVSAFRFGFALASVVRGSTFQTRALGLPLRVAALQSRLLGASMFLTARSLAVRVLLSCDEQVAAATFEELTSRVFGAPLPRAMCNAWPEPQIAEPARFVGLLGTGAFVRDLVERYDEDWFRNPKAGTHLVSLACGPAFDADPLPDGAPLALARTFEEALG
jgi:hypothetical protein